MHSDVLGYGLLYIVENKNHFLVIFSMCSAISGVMGKRGEGFLDTL